jgi:hypothetical protein
MTSTQITCPRCGEAISIDQALTTQITNQIKDTMSEQLRRKEEELQSEKAKLESAKKDMQVDISKQVTEKLTQEKALLWQRALQEAQKREDHEKKLLEDQLKEKDASLKVAREKELEVRRAAAKFAEEKAAFELEKQRQIDEERAKIIAEAGKRAAEEQQYKLAALQKKLDDALKANEDQKRKLEQGSQQTQGEVLELELEQLLKSEFIYDHIDPVPKGTTGADIIQKVYSRQGTYCGQIIWECKRTKQWSEGWVQKLKDDQRATKADVAIIVSTVLPEGVVGFGLREGVWVAEIKLTLAIATIVRRMLESLAFEKTSSVGKNEKMEMLYRYLTGVEFTQRIEAIVEAFSDMDTGLRKERLAYEKMWAEREKQIRKVVMNTVGMYGDLSGLVTLPTIKSLELESPPLLTET